MRPAKYMIWVFVLLISVFFVSANPLLNPVGDRTVNEGQALSIQLTSTAADNGAKVYSTTATKGTLNAATGLYTWTPGYADAETYEVTFRVSDADSTDSEDITITVINVNRQPHITSTATTTALVGSLYSYQIVAQDPDMDTLTYSLVTAPTGMTIGSTTGLVQWTPSAVGTFTVKVRASDGALYDEQQYVLTVTQPGSALDVPDVTVGSSTSERGHTYSKTFIIKNVGVDPLSSFQCTSTAASKYNVTFTNLPVSLNSGEQAAPTVSVYAPEDQNGGVQLIGSLTCQATGTALTTDTASLYLQVENLIEIRKMKLETADDSATITEGDKFTVKPGDKVTFSIELRNVGSLDLDEVTVTLESDGLDLDEDEDLSGLDEGERETIEFSFIIDSDVDQDDYRVDVIVEGEDEDGGVSKLETYFVLKVKKEKHDIRITGTDFSSPLITCGGTTDLTIRIENIGRSDEEDVAVLVENSGLSFSKKETGIELDEGDYKRLTFNIDLSNDVKEGTYPVRITAYYDDTIKTDTKTIDLYVQKCKEEPVVTPPKVEEPVVIPPVVQPPVVQPPVVQPPTYQPVYGSEDKESFMESTGYLVLLSVLALVLVILIIVLLVKLAR